MFNSYLLAQNSEDLLIRLQYKLHSTLKNKSNLLLGIDVLRTNKKVELLKIVALKIENKILNSENIDFGSVNTKKILLDLIKTSTEEFLISCYGSNLQINSTILTRSLYVQFILENSNILLQLPFQALYNLTTKDFCLTFEPVYTKPSNKFLEALFENLVVEISNCVMQIVIVEFSFIDHIRQVLYRSNFLSLRNIERFKNNIAWQNRLKLYVSYPKNLYSSQYSIWIIRKNGIYYRTIYANRSVKLLQLKKTSLLTITLVEFQDFLASRLDEVLYLIGDRLRYTLTTIVGQFIGLIWRGIIEGLKK